MGVESVVPPHGGTVRLASAFYTLAKNDPLEFRRQCGDTFVSARYSGAELNGMIAFSHVQSEQSEQLKVSVEGSGWNVFSASSSLNTEMKRASEHSDLAIHYMESGGAGDPIPTDQPGLIVAVQALPAKAQSAPSFSQAEVLRYEALNDWPGHSESHSIGGIERISSRYQQFSSLRDEVHKIQAKPDDYIIGNGVDLGTLGVLDQELYVHVQRLYVAAKTCSDSAYAICAIDPRDDVTDYTFRARLTVPRYSFFESWSIPNEADGVRRLRNTLAHPNDSFTPGFVAVVRSQIQAGVQNFNHSQAEYPNGLRRAIAAKWITPAVHDRCDSNPISPDCISPVQEAAIVNGISIAFTPAPAP